MKVKCFTAEARRRRGYAENSRFISGCLCGSSLRLRASAVRGFAYCTCTFAFFTTRVHFSTSLRVCTMNSSGVFITN